MSVERTVEFILHSQAKAEVRMDRLESQVKSTANLVHQGMKIVQALALDRREMRQEQRGIRQEQRGIRQEQRVMRQEQRVMRQEQRDTRQDLRLLAQEVRDLAKRHDDLAKSHSDLAKAQARTETTLERYLKSLSNGRNGRKRNGP